MREEVDLHQLIIRAKDTRHAPNAAKKSLDNGERGKSC